VKGNIAMRSSTSSKFLHWPRRAARPSARRFCIGPAALHGSRCSLRAAAITGSSKRR